MCKGPLAVFSYHFKLVSYSLIMLSAVVLIGSSVFSVCSVVSPACLVLVGWKLSFFFAGLC